MLPMVILKKRLLDYMDSYNVIVGNVLLISHYNVLHGGDFTTEAPLLYSQIAVRKALVGLRCEALSCWG